MGVATTKLEVPVEQQKCENCFYFRNEKGSECRRNPPTVLPADDFGPTLPKWASVAGYEWCGEWREKKG